MQLLENQNVLHEMRKAEEHCAARHGYDWVFLQMFASSDILVQELSSVSCSLSADTTIYFDSVGLFRHVYYSKSNQRELAVSAPKLRLME